MKFDFRVCLAGIAAFVLSGCSTIGSGWSGDRLAQPLDSITVLLDVNAIESATAFSAPGLAGYTSIPDTERLAQDKPLTTQISQAVSRALKQQLEATGVKVEVRPLSLRREVIQKGTTTTVNTYTLTREEQFKGVTTLNQPALMVLMDRYEMRSNTDWTGVVGWRYRLVRPRAWIDQESVMWQAQSPTMDFSERKCAGDNYATCSSEFAQKVVAVLRDQKIIK